MLFTARLHGCQQGCDMVSGFESVGNTSAKVAFGAIFATLAIATIHILLRLSTDTPFF
jgi:hypothetical protein